MTGLLVETFLVLLFVCKSVEYAIADTEAEWSFCYSVIIDIQGAYSEIISV